MSTGPRRLAWGERLGSLLRRQLQVRRLDELLPLRNFIVDVRVELLG